MLGFISTGAHSECHIGRWCRRGNLCRHEHRAIWSDADWIFCWHHLYARLQIPHCELEVKAKRQTPQKSH